MALATPPAFASADTAQITVAGWVRAASAGNSAYPRIFDTPGYRLFFRFDNQGSNGFRFCDLQCQREW